MSHVRAARLCLLLALLLSPWHEVAAYNGSDVSALHLGGPVQLTDHHGHRRSLADFHGKVVLLFFGYTRCPDVCPVTLSRLARVMKLLGSDAGRVQVLWVTVDPARDTQKLLSSYVPAFNPAFLGLRGNDRETVAVASQFRIQYAITRFKGEILVDHTSSGFLIDPNGQARLKLGYDLTAEQIAADVRAVLSVKP